jgi:hypothetical protein
VRQGRDFGRDEVDTVVADMDVEWFMLCLDRLAGCLCKGRVSVRGCASRSRHLTTDVVVKDHFGRFSAEDHCCRETMSKTLSILAGRPARIVETGSSAWGTNSSLLFDSYVNSFEGRFDTVDIRIRPAMQLRKFCTAATRLHCDDSVSFLERYARDGEPVDLVYLDSWDVNWNDPIPSALHGLREFFAVLPCLRSGSLVLIDDTPANESVMGHVQPGHVAAFTTFMRTFGFAPGKGSLVGMYLQTTGRGRLLAHGYQVLWEII